ncbi:MAG: hypothetical protein AAGB29_11260 [Planctomycetota bacterium]
MKSLTQACLKLGRTALALAAAVALVGTLTLSAGVASAESGCHRKPPPKADIGDLFTRAD